MIQVLKKEVEAKVPTRNTRDTWLTNEKSQERNRKNLIEASVQKGKSGADQEMKTQVSHQVHLRHILADRRSE